LFNLSKFVNTLNENFSRLARAGCLTVTHHSPAMETADSIKGYSPIIAHTSCSTLLSPNSNSM